MQRESECVCGARVTSKDCTAYTVVYSLWSRVSECGPGSREAARPGGRGGAAVRPPAAAAGRRPCHAGQTRWGCSFCFLYSSMQVTVHWRISRVLSWRPSLSGGLGRNKKLSASYKYLSEGLFSQGSCLTLKATAGREAAAPGVLKQRHCKHI